ncbi:hypothetical protein E4T48_02428 [Aureobasidium sp. EXF-10727]|nr:hypothetical protein E4T48_02428 [Aureobasidium sp. EXF-10727]
MNTTVTSLFSLTEVVPNGSDGKPLRRSERLAKLKRGDDLVEERQTVVGTKYSRGTLVRPNGKRWKLFAVKALDINLDNLWPGKIVKAIDCYPSTNLKNDPYDNTIGTTSVVGPIQAKFRYMIVVWRTDQGVAAIPLYTLKETSLRKTRWEELVSVCTVDETGWKGDTPWAGMPILAKFAKEYNCEAHCFADLSRPHWIGRFETVIDDVGYVDGGEYSKLMDLLQMKERQFRTAAFARFNTDGKPEVYEPWTPTKKHQPKAGVRFQDDKVNRMNFQQFKHRA